MRVLSTVTELYVVKTYRNNVVVITTLDLVT